MVISTKIISTIQKGSGEMIKTGIHIIPQMPPDEVVATIEAAEKLGYEYCLVADEGFMPDIYVTLGTACQRTSKIILGPITNGYTRHPAVTASAMATLNILSGGRSVITLVAGGTLVLQPMGIERNKPLTVVRESIDIMRRLWQGQEVNRQGEIYRLDAARMLMESQHIPIWVAGRGNKMLQLAGELSDGVLFMIKDDLPAAIQNVEQGAAQRREKPQRVYLDLVAYNQQMMQQAMEMYVYILLDMPPRQLEQLQLSTDLIENIRQALVKDGPSAAARLISLDMLKKFQIAGTPQECSQTIQGIVKHNELDVFLLNIDQSGLDANIKTMRDVMAILKET